MPRTTISNQTHALITLYVKLYTDKYEKPPVINRYREKWGFQSMIEDLGYERAREVVEYYFNTKKPGHPVPGLLFNYEKLSITLEEMANDEAIRAELRAQTKQRVEEWERMYGD